MAVLGAAGCATDSSTRLLRAATSDAPPGSPLPTRSVSFAVARIGGADYDRFTPPLASPNLRYIAIQTSSNCRWTDRLGIEDSGSASETAPRSMGSVALYEVTGDSLWRIHDLEPGLLLGRFATDEGVLVERSNADGSRWIGIAIWESGDIRWLVQDAAFNSQASLATDGTIAYSRLLPASLRGTAPDQVSPGLEVVVRGPSGELVLPAPDGGSLIAPTIEANGGGVYVLLLRDGELSALWVDLRSPGGTPAEMLERAAEVRLSDRGTARMAYNSIVPLGDSAKYRSGGILLATPNSGLIVWNGRIGATRDLPAGSQAVSPLSDGSELLLLSGRLVHRGSDPADDRSTVIVSGNWVPMRSASDGGVLLFHPEGDRFEFSMFRLVNR